MPIDEILFEMEEKTEKTIESFISALQSLRTGRATPILVDKIKVESYGVMTPLKAVASLSVPEPRILAIQPWDKQMLAPIEKAILASDLGITPANDGDYIRLIMPEMTEDRRKDMVKLARTRSEDAKVSIRNARRDANTQLKKLERDKVITEDESKGHQKSVQDLTDQYILKVENILQSKEKDILEI
ncbi:ribosome recycling factor [bacterium]|jgi:ribosome recycling factor|nr:ribosome recycling factor [bacterium]